jgi:hypothetical protein
MSSSRRPSFLTWFYAHISQPRGSGKSGLYPRTEKSPLVLWFSVMLGFREGFFLFGGRSRQFHSSSIEGLSHGDTRI